MRLENATASWSAVALYRFRWQERIGIEHAPSPGMCRAKIKRKRTGALHDASRAPDVSGNTPVPPSRESARVFSAAL
jgi:hypothetical protein